jgi:STE24 endopeptidase
MIHAIVLGLYIILGMRELFAAEAAADPLPLLRLSPASAILWSLVALAAVTQLTSVLVWRESRRLNRSGLPRHVDRAHTIVQVSRYAILLVFAGNVFVLGWLDAIREITGDLVLIDELLALLPPLVALCAGWWSLHPIDRRLREAVLLGMLDAGESPPSLPTRLQFVAEHLRHQVLLIAVPVLMISTWWEVLDRAARAAVDRWSSLADVSWMEWALGVAHFGGVFLILAVMPVLLRWMWRTTPLGAGPLRDRLQAMCLRHRIRVRELLVWHSYHGMINGALVGIIPPFRYILLTDALLQRLPGAQVEAVMAHEIAHARRRHLPWMLAVMVVTLGLSWALATWLIGDRLEGASGATHALSVGTVSILLTLLVFGHVSRRFEQQADAFAAQHLSVDQAEGDAEGRIHPAAAGAMAAALGSVARLNRAEPNRFSFRHGSIAARQRRLRAIVGLPVDRLPVDRHVRALKLLAIAGIMLMAALAWWKPHLFLTETSHPPESGGRYTVEACGSPRCTPPATTTSSSMPSRSRRSSTSPTRPLSPDMSAIDAWVSAPMV